MRTIFRRKLHIPRSARVILFPIVAIFIILAAIVYGRRLPTQALTCLYRDSIWIHTVTGDQFRATNLRVRRRIVSQNPFQVLIRPALVWAAYRQRQAFLEFGVSSGQFDSRLVITSPDEDIHREFEVNLARFYNWEGYSYIPEYVWAKDGSYAPSLYLSWSPDGRYILLQSWDGSNSYGYTNSTASKIPGFWHYSLFGIDGTAYPDFLIAPQTEQTPFGADLGWTSDSRLVVISSNVSRMGSWLTIPPELASTPTDVWMAAPIIRDDKLTVALYGKGRFGPGLVPGADNMGIPSWSPDGQWVAVVWATGQASTRVVRLSWMNITNQSPSTLDDHLWDVRELIWLADGKSLAYVAQRGTDVSVEIVDLSTGARRVLRSQLENAARLNQNGGLVTFWWRDHDKGVGIASYSPDGRLIHEARLAHPIKGLEVFRSPYQFVRWPEIYPSPDGRIFAVRFDRATRQSTSNQAQPLLQLIAADGSWSTLVYGKANPQSSQRTWGTITNLLWSPDSKRLLFSYATNSRPEPIDILDNKGTVLSTIRVAGHTAGFTWNSCN